MQQTSETYNAIMASGDYYVETAVAIGTAGTLSPESAFGEDSIISITTRKRVFSNNYLEVGCCVCGEIDLEMYNPTKEINRMAQIIVFVRLVSIDNEAIVSEWIKKGVFFIDTRETTKDNDGIKILTIHGYDAMMKAEAQYGNSTLSFPTTDITLIRDIASKLGVSLDSRCVQYFDKSYTVQYPAQYTMRETLSNIAKMYAGNFIINDCGELQFIPIWDLPPETNYLLDDNNNRLTFGKDAEYPQEDVRILI